MPRFARVISAFLLAASAFAVALPPTDATQINTYWLSNADGQTKRYLWNYRGELCGPNLNHTQQLAIKLGTVYADRVYVEYIEYTMMASTGDRDPKVLTNQYISFQDTYGVYNYQPFPQMWSGVTYRRNIGRWLYDRNGTGIVFELKDHDFSACKSINTVWVDLRPLPTAAKA